MYVSNQWNFASAFVWDKDGKLFPIIVPTNKEERWKRLMY